MNRRGFLGALAGIVASSALDPERALWVQGKKLISIPKVYSNAEIRKYVEECMDAAARQWGNHLDRLMFAGTHYHQVVATDPPWLGLSRSSYPIPRIHV